MFCSNCGKYLKNIDHKKTIVIHGLTDGAGIAFGNRDFAVNPHFCTKECACEYFSDASDVISEKCGNCGDPYSTFMSKKLLCEDPRCPYIKENREYKLASEMRERVVKRDGGIVHHVIKTCIEHYFGDRDDR
jgi:hypothetical protein